MSPWSDVRTLAQSLMDGDDYVTFVDVLPLQRLAHSLLHMPEPTVAALIALHDAPKATLGAKDVLMQILRGYHTRAEGQRRLGQKPLRLGHDGQKIRLQVGEMSLVVLLRTSTTVWETHIHRAEGGDGEAPCPIALAPIESNRRDEQRLEVRAVAPGVAQLRAQRVAAPSVRQRILAPAATQHGATRRADARANSFTLTVIVEPTKAATPAQMLAAP